MMNDSETVKIYSEMETESGKYFNGDETETSWLKIT